MERLTKFITPVGMVMTNLNSMKHYMPCVPCRHNAKIKYDSNGNGYTEKFSFCDTCEVKMLFNRLAEYEDLEEQGLLLRLPCKVGTRIYKIVYYLDREFCGCCIDDYGYDCKCKYYDDENDTCLNKIIDNERYEIISKQFNFDMISNFGKTVFLTKEEAEARLKELEGSEDK